MRALQVTFILVAVASLVPAGLVNATVIPVENAGFDYTTWNSATPETVHSNSAGWMNGSNDTTAVTFTSYGAGANGDNMAQMSGWISSEVAGGGQMDNAAGEFQANNWPGLNNAFGAMPGSGHVRTLTSIPIASALQPNTTYTLSATWYGNPFTNATIPYNALLIDLTDSSGTALSTLWSANLTSVAPSDNGPGSLTYAVTTGAGQASGALKVVLGTNGSDGNHLFAFDNVALSGTVVPEPSTITLLSCGLFGLLAYAWRKQR